jgi:hypothetical protein
MFKFLWQKPFNAFLLIGGSVVGTTQTFLGLEPKGRELTPKVTNKLQKIYADSLDFAKIRLKEGEIGLFGFGGAPFTYCNTIYIPAGRLPPAEHPDYEDALIDLLAHEVHHVWQYQNGGADYMSDSLVNQFAAHLKTGTRNGAYDFERGINEGKTWAQLNPEQQAYLIEKSYKQGLFEDENARLIWNDIDYTDYAREAIRQMRLREGAP